MHQRVEGEDEVLDALLHKLFAGVLEQLYATVTKEIAHLEAVNGVGNAGSDLLD